MFWVMSNARFFHRLAIGVAITVMAFLAVGCASAPVERAGVREVPVSIMGRGAMSASRLASFFIEENPSADRNKVGRMARYYIDEAGAEGVNADVAFVQMCLETGFLRFGGDVTVDMNNFCGLGTTGNGVKGASFPDERTGVRAHVQHLKAYASPEPLRGSLVDPRYKYVNPKGKAPTVYGLAGTWAADKRYGEKLEGLLRRLYS
jgi:hypothetical protein